MARKYTTENFNERLHEISKDYNLVGEYTAYQKKIQLKHLTCGHIYSTTPSNFIGLRGFCSYCAQLKRNQALSKTLDEFQNQIYELENDNYKVNEYYGANRKVKFWHKDCNQYFNMTPSNFLQGQRCPHCFSSESRRYSKKEVQEIINKKLDENYILQSEYKNNHTKIFVYHSQCQNIWETTLRGINCGNRCPFCTKISKGEERILKFLKENNINAVYQYQDVGCQNKNPLIFDFYLKDYNLLIEYDGVFHYEPIYGENVLQKQKINDEIKNEFIKSQKKYSLLRIPYWDFDNIEKILTERLFNI